MNQNKKLKQKTKTKTQGHLQHAFYRALAFLLDMAIAWMIVEILHVYFVNTPSFINFIEAWQIESLHLGLPVFLWPLWWLMVIATCIVQRTFFSMLLGVTPGYWPLGIRVIKGNIFLAGLRAFVSTISVFFLLGHLPLLWGRRSFPEWMTGTILSTHHPWQGRLGVLFFSPLFLAPLIAPLFFNPSLSWPQRVEFNPEAAIKGVQLSGVNFSDYEMQSLDVMGMELLVNIKNPDFFMVGFMNETSHYCLALADLKKETNIASWCLLDFIPMVDQVQYLRLRTIPWQKGQLYSALAHLEKTDQIQDSQEWSRLLFLDWQAYLEASVLDLPNLLFKHQFELPFVWQMKRRLVNLAGSYNKMQLKYSQEIWGRTHILRSRGEEKGEFREDWLVPMPQGLLRFRYLSHKMDSSLLEELLGGVRWVMPSLARANQFLPYWNEEKEKTEYYTRALKKVLSSDKQSVMLFLRKLMQ